MSVSNDTGTKTLEDVFIWELKEKYDAENRLGKMLFTIAQAASCWNLKKKILDYQLQTEGHVMKLEQIFGCFEHRVTGKTSKVTIGFMEECDEISKEFSNSPAINAALVSFLQTMGRYEIASYESMLDLAGLLRNPEAADLLEETISGKVLALRRFVEFGRTTDYGELHSEPDWEDVMREDQIA